MTCEHDFNARTLNGAPVLLSTPTISETVGALLLLIKRLMVPDVR